MLGDLLNPWCPETAYRDWLRAGQLAVQAELIVARKRMGGPTPTDDELAAAIRLRATADSLRSAAVVALGELRAAAPIRP